MTPPLRSRLQRPERRILRIVPGVLRKRVALVDGERKTRGVLLRAVLGRHRGAAARRHRGHPVAEIDRDGRRLLIEPIHDKARDVLIARVAVQEQESAESMLDQVEFLSVWG